MKNQFDELTKSLAESATRRTALKKLAVGLVAGIAAMLGIQSASAAPKRHGYCVIQDTNYNGICLDPATCQQTTTGRCQGYTLAPNILTTPCGSWVDLNRECSY